MTNDTDVDSVANGETKTVTVGTGVRTGTYGSLTLNADGSYSYVVDESNAAVQALRVSGQTVSETFTYTMRDTGGLTSSSTLTVTVDGRNDTPVANADVATAIEAGGLNNGTAGTPATGNVLTNDTDVDANDTKIVSGVSNNGVSGVLGQIVAGSYGALRLNADGSYTYAVDNNNTAVQALNVGDTLTDTYNYTMKDTAGATSSTTLAIVIHGANDNPVNTLPTDPIVSALQAPVSFGGLHVDDVDSPTVTVTLSVTHGVLQLHDPGSSNLTISDNGSGSVTLNGSLTEINTLIAGRTALTYISDQTFSGSDPFTMSTNDGHVTVTNSTNILVTQRTTTTTVADSSSISGNSQTAVSAASSLPVSAVVTAPAPIAAGAAFTIDTGSAQADSSRMSQEPRNQPAAVPVTSTARTQSGGLVIIGGEDSSVGIQGLYIAKTPSSQESLVNEVSSFNLPQGIFRHSDSSATVKVEAKLADGRPLPNWMSFDSASGRFTATPPTGTGGAMDIKVMAHDQNGNVAETQFLFHITESKSNKPAIVGANSSEGGAEQKDGKSGRDSQESPVSPRTDVRDGLNAQKHAASRAIKGRPSLSDQMAAFGQRSRMPTLFTAIHKSISSISKGI